MTRRSRATVKLRCVKVIARSSQTFVDPNGPRRSQAQVHEMHKASDASRSTSKHIEAHFKPSTADVELRLRGCKHRPEMCLGHTRQCFHLRHSVEPRLLADQLPGDFTGSGLVSHDRCNSVPCAEEGLLLAACKISCAHV